jgi:hypothetical protein
MTGATEHLRQSFYKRRLLSRQLPSFLALTTEPGGGRSRTRAIDKSNRNLSFF